jgi:small subunit ribosomal protein S17
MSTAGKKSKEVRGEVVGNSMDKTIVVSTERFVKHPRYKKYIRRSTVYKAHDPDNEAYVGDKVIIGETRPLSKTKRWRLVRILEQAPRT